MAHKNVTVYLWLDQYGNHVHASTVKELREKAGGGRVDKMYYENKSGEVIHDGYVVGQRWFRRFAPSPIPSKKTK